MVNKHNVIKEAKNNRFGKVLDCAITYGYKVSAQGSELNPKFLFDLQLLSFEKFKVEYDEKNKNTHVANYIIDKPMFKQYVKDLERVFLIKGIGRN